MGEARTREAEKVRKVWDCREGWDVVNGKGRTPSLCGGGGLSPGKGKELCQL